MRLFFALNLDESAKDSVEKLIFEMRTRTERGNFTSRENLHLTLAFLGEVDPNRLPELKKILSQLDSKPMSLVLSRFGTFGREPSSRTVWIGIDPDECLTRLAETLRSSLRNEGFSFDEKPFLAHLTLGREVRMSPDGLDNDALRTFLPISFVPIRISLMESIRQQGKLVYREISGTSL